MIFGFKKTDAIKLKRSLGPNQAGPVNLGPQQHLDGWLLVVPAGGIPKRQGMQAGSAICQVLIMDVDGNITPYTTQGGSEVRIRFYNIAPEEVRGGTICQAKNMFGLPTVDFEPCMEDLDEDV